MTNPQSKDQKALSNLLDAVEGVLQYTWDDNDDDAVEAVDRLRTANEELGVVQRLSEAPATPSSNGRSLATIALSVENTASWLEKGLDPKYAAAELRILATHIRGHVETSSPQAPIASVFVHEDGSTDVELYAPGLPVGGHDLYCDPEATAPYLRAEKTSAMLCPKHNTPLTPIATGEATCATCEAEKAGGSHGAD